MAVGRLRRHAEALGGGLVLPVDLGDVLLVQVDAMGRLRGHGGEGERQGREHGKVTNTTAGMHHGVLRVDGYG